MCHATRSSKAHAVSSSNDNSCFLWRRGPSTSQSWRTCENTATIVLCREHVLRDEVTPHAFHLALLHGGRVMMYGTIRTKKASSFTPNADTLVSRLGRHARHRLLVQIRVRIRQVAMCLVNIRHNACSEQRLQWRERDQVSHQRTPSLCEPVPTQVEHPKEQLSSQKQTCIGLQ